MECLKLNPALTCEVLAILEHKHYATSDMKNQQQKAALQLFSFSPLLLFSPRVFFTVTLRKTENIYFTETYLRVLGPQRVYVLFWR